MIGLWAPFDCEFSIKIFVTGTDEIFFQVLSVAIPAIIFMVYTAHKLTKIDHAKKLKKKEEDKKKREKEEAKKLRQEAREKARRAMTEEEPPGKPRKGLHYKIIRGHA